MVLWYDRYETKVMLPRYSTMRVQQHLSTSGRKSTTRVVRKTYGSTLPQHRITPYVAQTEHRLPIARVSLERLDALLPSVVSLIVNFRFPSPDIVGLYQNGNTPNVSFSSVLRSHVSVRYELFGTVLVATTWNVAVIVAVQD